VAKLVSEEFFLQGDLEMEEFKEQPAVRYIEHIITYWILSSIWQNITILYDQAL
jgi:hypothetical protein